MATLCFLIEKTGWPLNYIYSLDIEAYKDIVEGFIELDKSRKGGKKEDVSQEEFDQIISELN
jgi:hypothetical protein